MKTSIALAIVILVIGMVPGLFQQRRLSELREEHRTLVTEAVKYGLSDVDVTDSRLTKKKRVEIGKEAGLIADEIVALHVDLQSQQASGAGLDHAAGDRMQEIKSRFTLMDAAVRRQVIVALEGRQDIPDEVKREMIGSSILHLADAQPQQALDLFMQAYGILAKCPIGEQVVSSALKNLAADSPESALSWIQANSDRFPDVTGEESKRAVMSGVASNDPARAFKLIGELHPEDESAAIRAIVDGGHESPEKRDQLLVSLRQHLSGVLDEQARQELGADAFESLAIHLSKGGFEASTAWVDKAGLSAGELAQFSTGLSYFSTRQETGRWMDWVSANLAAESATGPVSAMVSEWTQKDYQAAGGWLLSAKDGPVKTSAVQAYAIVVAEHDPAVAAQWAMTLPAGPARDSTLRAIHQNWPASDPEGAAAFARENGLK